MPPPRRSSTFPKKPRTPRSAKSANDQAAPLSAHEDMQISCEVCELHLAGHSPEKIAEIIEERHPGVQMTRVSVYPRIRQAALQRWLRFSPPQIFSLEQDLRMCAKWLRDVRVVDAPTLDSIPNHAAEIVFSIILEKRAKEVIHIGLGGGRSASLCAQTLARLIASRKPSADLLPALHFHCLVPGIDGNQTQERTADAAPPLSDQLRLLADPTAFFTYLATPDVRQQTRGVHFTTLNAPSIVRSKERDALLEFSSIKRAMVADDQPLDIVVSSIGDIDDEHSMFTPFAYPWESAPASTPNCASPQQPPGSAEIKAFREQLRSGLKERGCVGDIMWLPISDEGPLSVDGLELVVVSAITLEQLQRRVEAGTTRVVLAVGLCDPPRCRKRKDGVLHALLAMGSRSPKPVQLFTDIVVERETARKVIERIRQPSS